MSEAMLSRVAEHFRLLGEPARLRILNALRPQRELTVTQLVELTGLGQANLSKHLQLLHAAAFVSRRREGLYVWYAIADQETIELCDLMCARLDREAEPSPQASPA
ncbi:MAG TPA: metalloregulator ArsR/SmtB family transcription factor [Gemmatimonadales bacterium]|jgi:DNA-binding transcriptional ArsR family regulator|nr:metalloregulator ArsR/SmtB family transcription factor [Gemmatimonadales bacterium]